MSKHKTKPVRYVSKIVSDDGYNSLKYDSKDVQEDFVKAYHNTLLLLSRVPDSAKNLMLYLVEKMSDDNLVHSNETTRKHFTAYMFNSLYKEYKELVKDDKSKYFGQSAKDLATAKTYKNPTISAAFHTLKNHDMLISTARGEYRVNPEFFYRKSEAERMKSIKMTLEFNAGVKDIGMGISPEYV
jgi:hypothetical protein